MRDSTKARRCSVDSMTAEYSGGYTTITLSNDTWRAAWNFIVYALEIIQMNKGLHSNLPSWHEPDEEEIKTVSTFQRVLVSMLTRPSTGQEGE